MARVYLNNIIRTIYCHFIYYYYNFSNVKHRFRIPSKKYGLYNVNLDDRRPRIIIIIIINVSIKYTNYELWFHRRIVEY